jgi:hypothetical protein
MAGMPGDPADTVPVNPGSERAFVAFAIDFQPPLQWIWAHCTTKPAGAKRKD